MDTLTPEQRSRLMSRVRQKSTAPELALRQKLWSKGLKYRLKHNPKLPGSPDIIFPGAKLAIFVDGCFWHSCPIHRTSPKTNAEFWNAKLLRNVQRDKEVDEKLRLLGWRVIRLWQHEIKDNIDLCEQKIRNILKPKV